MQPLSRRAVQQYELEPRRKSGIINEDQFEK